MRDLNDVRTVKFQLPGAVQIDLERLKEDPMWEHVAESARSVDEALGEYVRLYLSQELLLTQMPCTNGPASLFGASIEVVEKKKCQNQQQ